MPTRNTKDNRGKNWNLTCTDDQLRNNRWDGVDIQITLLADIRDELRTIREVLTCPNFQALPRTLKQLNQRLLKLGVTLRPK